MVTAVDSIAQYVSREGSGRLQTDFGHAAQGLMVVHLERNALAEALGPAVTPRCQLMVGFLRAVYSHLAARRLAVSEVSCCAQGHERCTFVIAAENRGSELDEAIATAGRSLDAVVAKLGGDE